MIAKPFVLLKGDSPRDTAVKTSVADDALQIAPGVVDLVRMDEIEEVFRQNRRSLLVEVVFQHGVDIEKIQAG